jgi:hypothetical protein
MGLFRRGDRGDLMAGLEEQAEGWDHQGNPELAAQMRAAAGELRKGARSVTAGHQRFDVDAGDSGR